MQLLDLYAQSQTHDEAQLELFKKAFSNMNSSASIGIVQRFYGDSVDSGLVQASKRLTEQEASIPDLSTNSQVRAAEEALCVMHLHNACRRIGIHPLTRAGFSALYLGEYAEVRTRFSGCVRVTCNDIRRFLRDEPSGRLFWTALCQRCGLPRDSYDSSKYQIEHVLNDSWGGADHYINFMVLFTQLNNSAEFRYGPGEVKMITLGKNKYQLVQRFARWDQKAGGNVPRDEFFKIESEHYALPPVSITGGHQLKIRDCLSGKKRTRC